MISPYKIIIFIILFVFLGTPEMKAQTIEITLPQPQLSSGKTLRKNIQERYSNRNFNYNKPLSIEELSTILWATYGKKIKNNETDTITSASYTIPSAGAIYPLEIFVVIGEGGVINLKEGIYYYIKEKHALKLISNIDKRKNLASACLNQKSIETAPLSILIAANIGSMEKRYGNRAERYTTLEAGHAAQNLYLIVNDLGLSTVEIGAFDDEEVAKILNIPYPVALVMPIGYKE